MQNVLRILPPYAFEENIDDGHEVRQFKKHIDNEQWTCSKAVQKNPKKRFIAVACREGSWN